jgi:hypothetical protein
MAHAEGLQIVRAAAALLASALAGCSAVTISSDFEGGHLGAVERLSEARFRCAVPGQADQDGRNRQVTWYFFRVDGARGRPVTITLTDLRGEYDYRPGAVGIDDRTPPVVSADGCATWTHLPPPAFDRERAETTFTFTPAADSVFVAHVEPYTASRLDRVLAEIRAMPGLTDEVIGKSVEGRDLHLLTIGSGPRTVWLMCRQHAWESGTSWVGEGAIRFLLSDEGRPWRERVTFRILPMLDPDGCARGGVRFNRNGYDLNRNWDTADPDDPAARRLMPEICAAKAALRRPGRFDLFLTLHNQESGGWMSGSERHGALAARLFDALKSRTVVGDGPRTSRERPARGRATVYEYLEGELGLPAFILEQGIATDPILGRPPTSADRLEFGRHLAVALAECVLNATRE